MRRIVRVLNRIVRLKKSPRENPQELLVKRYVDSLCGHSDNVLFGGHAELLSQVQCLTLISLINDVVSLEHRNRFCVPRCS
jgi:hypothetical protein